MRRKPIIWCAGALFVLFLAALDQVVKLLVIQAEKAEKLPVSVLGLLNIVYTENTGAAFSMLSGARWLLLGFSAAAIAAIVVFIAKGMAKKKISVWALLFILGGAMGNFVNRLFQGYVVDMFELAFIDFAIFNVADLWVTVGAILLFVWILFDRREESHDDSA